MTKILKRRIYCIETLLSDIDENELDESYISESVYMLFEGTTNKDMISKVKTEITEAKSKFREGRECFESGDINTANKHFKAAIKKLDEVESYCRNIDDFESTSKTIGNIIGTIMQFGWFIIGEAINLTIFGIRMHKGDKKFKEDMNRSYKKFESQINEEDSGKSVMSKFLNIMKLTNKMSEYHTDISTNYTDSQIRSDRYASTAQYANLALAIANIIKINKENKQILLSGKVPVGSNELRNRMILSIMKIKKNMEEQITIMNNYFK